MAHFSVHIYTKGAVPADLLKEAGYFADAMASLDIVSGTDVEVVGPKLTIKIEQDRDPQNPRVDFDHVGVMYCRHGRYNLGDKDAEDPYVEVDGAEVDGIWMTVDELDYAADCLTEIVDRDELEGVAILRTEHGPYDMCAVRDEFQYLINHCDTRYELRDDIALCWPLYLFDHSGLTISHDAFSDPWDAGQVGHHYITKAKLQEVWGGDVEAATRCLEAELKEYDHYLRGNVWWFTVEDEEGEFVNSCGGFYGDDLEETGILDSIDEELHDAAREAWERRFD